MKYQPAAVPDRFRKKVLTSFYFGNATEEHMQMMLDFIAEYQIDLKPAKIFHGLDQAADAHRYLEGNRSSGRTAVSLRQKK